MRALLRSGRVTALVSCTSHHDTDRDRAFAPEHERQFNIPAVMRRVSAFFLETQPTSTGIVGPQR
jgi:hypothetical protein